MSKHQSGFRELEKNSNQAEKPWMKSFGKLRGRHAETAKINRIIEAEFGQIEPEDRR